MELLKGLSGHKDIVCELAIMSYNIYYSDFKYQSITNHYLIRKITKDPMIFVKLYKICTQFRPDIIHTWDSMTSVYAFPVAKILDIKLINGMIRDARPKPNFFNKKWIPE